MTGHDDNPLSLRSARPRGILRRAKTHHGFTLFEVILSMMLIGTAALAGLSAMLFAYRLSDANLRQLGAVSAARAVAEQISTLTFDQLSSNTLPVDLPSSTTGSLTVNAWNNRTDDIFGTPGNTDDDLVLQLRPEITQSTASTRFACSQVIVRFRWEENAFFTTRTREESLTVVLSDVSAH